MLRKHLCAAVFAVLALTIFSYDYEGYYSVETVGAVSDSDTLPQWMKSNKGGVFSSEGTQSLTEINTEQKLIFSNDFSLGFGLRFDEVIDKEDDELEINEIYSNLEYKNIYIKTGKYREILGIVDEDLSSGSMVMSLNAEPIPRVSAGLDYTKVPFSNGLFEFKGMMSHGWVDDDRYVDNPWVHQKNLYLKYNTNSFMNITAGVNHQVIWAGTAPDETNYPDGLSDFVKVFFAQGGGDNALVSEQKHALGNHNGSWEIRFNFFLNNKDIFVYHQHYTEDGSGFTNLTNRFDGLYGFGFDFKNKKIINKLLFEYIQTVYQSGPIHPPGNDSYYSHYIYQNGWTYDNYVIGNSLFGIDEEIGRINNNRFYAFHSGIMGEISKITDYKLLYTYTRNYNSYLSNNDDELVSNGHKDMQYFAVDLINTIPLKSSNIKITGTYAYDFGDLKDNAMAFLMSVMWEKSF